MGQLVNDGLTYGLDQFTFNGKVLGYISEEGLAWGGEVAADGTYTPPVKITDLTGPAEIKCDSGHTISISNGSLSAKISGNINGSELLTIECELELLAATDGGAAYKILPPKSESGEVIDPME